MYTATMHYPVKRESMDDFVGLWKKEILDLAVGREGFVRMQLLTREDEAMACGTWKDKRFADAFMELGPFKKLMAEAKDYLRDNPKPTIWNLTLSSSD